ncbi:MAG TPA: hypothetical protein PLV27_04365 [Anaerolineaceae bacterium]|nr:hypothetical protein [Anaerolineaceae bacterium]
MSKNREGSDTTLTIFVVIILVIFLFELMPSSWLSGQIGSVRSGFHFYLLRGVNALISPLRSVGISIASFFEGL